MTSTTTTRALTSDLTSNLILVTGGARSGKSRFAEQLAASLGARVAYVATATPGDEEMQARIQAHKERRPPEWVTIEEPYDVTRAIQRLTYGPCAHDFDYTNSECTYDLDHPDYDPGKQLDEDRGNRNQGKSDVDVVLVDCITLLVSNLLAAGRDGEQVLAEISRLAEVASTCCIPVIVVSNEVGMGIVPEYPLARLYRDVHGRANQILAAAAREVYVLFSGIPLEIKRLARST
ncbi:MAG TPA: bifunctional adenosylcobinamide kinase/adenosylcobinamide-phosphate guanylyltransferase [Firmicutes bacterium]|nr:bifunctional adenosylcobinamide kinase/adenosylcobinamide-phosphate guanylyltransferase [Bacillota bacterium]